MPAGQLTDAILLLGPSANTADHPACSVVLARDYLEAGNVLFGHIPKDIGTSHHSLVVPMTYLYRHAIELSLKALIRAERYTGADMKEKEWDNANGSHGLVGLFEIANRHLPADAALSNEYRSAVEAFDKIDPFDDAFRYTTTRKGTATPASSMLDIRHLRELVISAQNEICGSVALELLTRWAHEEDTKAVCAAFS